VAAPEVPLQLAGLKCWFDSRTTAQMSPSPETGISSWTSRDGSMGPVALSQATPASRPMYVASVPQLGGRPGVFCDGVDDWLQALTPADWRFLHNGLGSTIFYLTRLDSTGPSGQTVVSTCAQANSVVGVNETLITTGFSTRISNGSGTAYQNVSAGSTAGHWERDVLRWRALTHGAGVRRAYAGGGAATVVTNDNGGAVAATGNSTFPLRLSVGGAAGIKGWAPQLLLYDRELSAAECNSLGAFFAPIYGFAA
jgi:hypothetical protein